MKRLLRFLWTGDWHLHKWVKENQTDVYPHNTTASNEEKMLPIARYVVCKCEICGKYTTFKI